MLHEQAADLIKSLGSEPLVGEDDWVLASCPLAPYTHKNGTDSNPSFGIKVEEGEEPYFHCFSCMGGSLEDLVGTLEMFIANDPSHAKRYDLKSARTILMGMEVGIVSLPEFSEFGNHKQQLFEEWPAWYIESFTPWQFCKPAFEYLKSRGLTGEQAKRFDLRYDSKKEMLVHPYSNVYGKLAGMRGRSIQGGKGHTGHYDYTWNDTNNANLVWYNEQALGHGEPVIVVEGQYDLYAVDRVYPYVVANLTAKPVAAKMSKLAQTPWVILFNDNDKAGQSANEKYLKYLVPQGIQVTTIDYPELLDAQGNPVKLDPDVMGSEWIFGKLQELGLV